jgi:hypothetical protein
MFKTIKVIFLFFIFLFLVAFKKGEALLYLKDQFEQAKQGQYFILAVRGNATLFHIHSKQGTWLYLEEISFPMQALDLKIIDWGTWLKQKAPCHTSWILSKINLETGQVEQSYSFVQKAHINRSQEFDFFTTLMNLKFQAVPFDKQRRVGIPPGPGEPDLRGAWHPPLPKALKNKSSQITVFKATWPKDGSDIAQKTLEIYFVEGVYFPIWIEIKGAPIKAKLFVLDCGTDLESPKNQIPLAPLYFINKPTLVKDKVKMTLPLAEHPDGFHIYLLDGNKVHPLSFHYQKNHTGFLIEIDQQQLKTLGLKSGKIVLTSKEHPEKTIESDQLRFD